MQVRRWFAAKFWVVGWLYLSAVGAGGLLNPPPPPHPKLKPPKKQEGILMRRSRKELEHDIGQYYVFTRDGLTVACGQLRKCVDICIYIHLICVCVYVCVCT